MSKAHSRQPINEGGGMKKEGEGGLMSLDYYIGTSGWHYDHWRGRFYPEKLARAKWLEFYTSHFATVELNNSFYRLPSEAAFTVCREKCHDTWYVSVNSVGQEDEGGNTNTGLTPLIVGDIVLIQRHEERPINYF